MGDDDNRRGDGGDGAPGIQFLNTFIVMEDVLDKLKLLDYEISFCKEWGFKPFPRYFLYNQCYNLHCSVSCSFYKTEVGIFWVNSQFEGKLTLCFA